MNELVTPAGTELRTAALAAEAYLVIDSAFKYGLLEGDLGGTINVERCEELIAEARAQGITFTQDEIDSAAAGIAIHHQRGDGA